jgi:hypothetical protein
MNTRTFGIALPLSTCTVIAGAQTPSKPAAAAHMLLTPGEMKSGPAPPVLRRAHKWPCWTATRSSPGSSRSGCRREPTL